MEKERVREKIGDETLRIKQKQTESQQNKVKRKIIPGVWGGEDLDLLVGKGRRKERKSWCQSAWGL